MQFRKFEAADMREALTAVKASLGADAVIVATRTLPPRGFMRRARLEVTAAIESVKEKPELTPPAEMTHESAFDTKLAPLRRELRALRGALRASEPEAEGLKREVSELRSLLASLTSQSAHVGLPRQDFLTTLLLDADVDAHTAAEIVHQTRRLAHAEGETGHLHGNLLANLKHAVADRLLCDDNFLTSEGPRRLALVGPTGIGKTTSIAKLAAHAAMRHNKRVALITLDTYRIGAHEQIQHYASLIRVPLELASDADSFAAAMKRHENADLVLVDTAGRGFSQSGMHRAQLSDMFSTHGVQTFLALAAATRRQEVRRIVEEFAMLSPRAVAFTKLDEALALGAMLNATHEAGVPLSFVTMGQRVPEDIAFANPFSLASQLIDSASETPQHEWQPERQAAQKRA